MNEPKASVLPNYQPAVARGGRGCGCLAAGCGVAMFGLMFMCMSGVYVTMFTSVPLSFIKRGIEAEGNVKVDGLTGSFSSGFQIDKLQFEGDGGKWSELRDIEFRYSGITDLIRGRLIINNASVGSGTIYAKFEDNNDFDFDPELDGEEIAEEMSEEFDDIRAEFEGDDDLEQFEELSIENASVTNLKIVDPDTDLTLEVQRAEFKDFSMIAGQITQLGHLVVESDQLDMQTSPSKVYAEEAVAWNLQGTIKARLHKRLIADVPFDLDFAFAEKNKVLSQISMFDGGVRLIEPFQNMTKYRLKDFSPSEFFKMVPPLAASHWNAAIDLVPDNESATTPVSNSQPDDESTSNDVSRSGETRRWSVTIKPGASFQMGNTVFHVETETVAVEEKAGQRTRHMPTLTAFGYMDRQRVEARLQLLDGMPYVSISLSGDGQTQQDLWGKLFFEKPFDKLEDKQQKQVQKSIQFGNDPSSYEEDPEASDEASDEASSDTDDSEADNGEESEDDEESDSSNSDSTDDEG